MTHWNDAHSSSPSARIRLLRAAALGAVGAAAVLVGQTASAQMSPSGAQSGAQITGTQLQISAVGEVRRPPEIAVISAGVATEAPVARTAMEDNRTRVNRMTAALKTAGINPKDIQTAQISLQPQYRYAEGRAPVITGYAASNTLTIRFRDLARAGSVLDTLVDQGANQISGPNFEFIDPRAALDEARAAAVHEARARAALYARETGMTVRRIVSISEEAASAPMPVMMRAMAKGESDATPIMAGETALSITVQMVFELN